MALEIIFGLGGLADEVYEIERAAFGDPWSHSAVCESIAADYCISIGARSEGILVGFALIYHIEGDEFAEVMDIATLPAYRRMGVGEALLSAAKSAVAGRGADRLELEVRISNAPAIGLYRKLGFADVGVRRGYYSRPREDALLMACNIQLN